LSDLNLRQTQSLENRAAAAAKNQPSNQDKKMNKVKKWIQNSNGWQRIGVVQSVLWILYAAFAERKFQMDSAGVLYQAAVGECTRGAPSEFAQCMGKIDEQYRVWLSIGGSELINIFVMAFGPVILGWLFVWLAVIVYRWVRAGFKPNDSQKDG
jgi:hypothetical protein